MRMLRLAGSLLAVTVFAGAIVSADLPGDLGQFTFPTTIFRPGTVNFEAGTGMLQVSATAVRTLMSNTDVRPHAASPSSTVNINAQVLNPAATEVAGVGANPLSVVGAFDVDGDGTVEPSESGVMLTGNLVEVQYTNLAPAAGGNDRIALRFTPTGGFLAPFYAGRNIGVDLAMPNDGAWPAATLPSTDFANSFISSVVTSQIKPIPCGVQVGEFVWHDVDADGVQDPGEPGINGVRVWLRNAAGSVIGTAITGRGPLNQGGYYLFEKINGFCAGEYSVEVDASTIPPGFYPTASGASSDTGVDSNESPVAVTLASDIATDHTVDFGFATVYSGRIGGRVWHDADGDGIQDDGEAGIDRVVVNAYDASGALVGTSSSIDGLVSFSGLEAGDYRLEPDASSIPRGFAPTLSHVGPPETDSDLPEAFISLTAFKTIDRSAGFGYIAVCTGTIGDYVWYDKNQNGVQDAGESGLSGVDVSLLAADGSTVATVSTGANGAYQFVGLCAGTYRVVIDQADLPAGFTPTVASVSGSDAAEDSNAIPAVVSLADDNTTQDSTDFGFIAPCGGSIGNRVWLDSNHNGVQDAGEPGFGGVTVNLRRKADYAVIQTDISDADGSYQFSGLCPGDYVVELALTDDLSLSPAGQGSPAADSNVNPSVASIAFDDTAVTDVDFGVYVTGQIGDFVWHDVNGDGIQGDGEPGIAGVTVRLTDALGSTISTVTNTAGAYLFANLAKGTYVVEVVPPAGYVGPTVSAAPRPDFDSNPNPSTVTLSHHDSKDFGADFGFTKSTPPPPPVPGIKIVKTADKHRVVYGESVTFTYTVTNTGTTILTDIVVRDDNATPTYKLDDFTVGTLTTLAPGASKTFSVTRVPPAKMCNEDRNGKLRKCGMMLFEYLSSHVQFTYLQSRDHRDDFRDWWSGWDAKRSYTKKGKFRIADLSDVSAEDVHTESLELDGEDGEEYVSAFKVSANKGYVAGNGYVKAPKIYHKKGWDGDWRDDWDYRWSNYNRRGHWDDDRSDRDNDHDYDYDKHPKLCPTTSTNIGTVTAKSDGVLVKATDKETVEIVGPPVSESYKTFTQGGWGSKPSGNNPGKFLVDQFKNVFPSGYVVVGGTKTIKLTSAAAIEKFLPQGGTPARLTQNYVNPTTQISVLAGQVLTLKLNVEFSAKGKTRAGLGNLTVISGELEGRTVNQVLTLANSVLGGGSLPSGLTLSDLNSIISKINENFDGGQNNGYLED
jgi:hypothetical protein